MSYKSDENLKGSEVRLWRMIEERTKPGADVARIDERIWDLFGDEWAIMYTDLAGFSRHAASFGIIHFLQIIYEHKKLLLPTVASHDGLLIGIEADSLLVLFKRTSSAVQCAIEMQRRCEETNVSRRPEDQILLCVGIGYGRVLRIGDSNVFGVEVNGASKLGEDTAKAYEILLTHGARSTAPETDGLAYEELELTIAGIERCYRLKYR